MQSSVPHQPSPFLFTTTARAEAHLILLFPLLPEYPPYTSLSPIESEITVLDTPSVRRIGHLHGFREFSAHKHYRKNVPSESVVAC